VQIADDAVRGEKGTGYEDYDHKGPFECANCKYFDDGICRGKNMIAKSKQPHRDGGVEVQAKGCCVYIERIGPKGSLTEAAKRG
jgi:hypothetical protein